MEIDLELFEGRYYDFFFYSVCFIALLIVEEVLFFLVCIARGIWLMYST